MVKFSFSKCYVNQVLIDIACASISTLVPKTQ